MGKTIVLHHGGKYSTLYAHLSKYAKRLKRGSIIKQGTDHRLCWEKQVWQTGPHLHYEFRINGIHRNPLTVQFPKAASIPTKYRQDFKDRTASLLVKLQDDLQSKLTIIALTDDSSDKAAATGNTLNIKNVYYIGLMSGTSMDAIDVALVQIKDEVLEITSYRQYPIPKKRAVIHTFLLQPLQQSII